jgi:hypothetical protein
LERRVLDDKTLQECADWIAEQLSEELGGFIAAELIDFIIAEETRIREEFSDADMDHHSMTGHLIPRMEAEGIPVKEGAVTPNLVEEILHWEDECRAMAGSPRNVRR